MYTFRFCFVRTIVHEEFGGFETSDVLRSGCFTFGDSDELFSCLVPHVLAAASSDLAGRGLRVYNFFELFGLIRSAFESFVDGSAVVVNHHLGDQTCLSVPTAPVLSVKLYYSFERLTSGSASLEQSEQEL